MNAKGSLIAQLRPGDTTINQIVVASLTLELTNIVICNTTASATTFSLYHDDKGTSYGPDTALYINNTIGANQTIEIFAVSENSGITLKKDGTLAVQSGAASALNFSIYGVSQDTQGIQTVNRGRV